MDDQPRVKKAKRVISPSGMRVTAAAADEAPPAGEPATDLVVPRALQPAAVRFATPESKVTMTAAAVSKPSQSLISARTGVMIGPGLPARVRVIR